METKKVQGPLTRVEHIKEETRLAAEFGQAPRRPLSVASNFRTEGLQRLAPPLPRRCMNVKEVMTAAPAVGPRANNAFVSVGRQGTLLAAIEDVVKRIDDGNRSLLVPVLLDHYGDFAAQAQDADQLKALQKRVMTAAFGDDYFKQMQGGNAQQHCATPGKSST
jgi:hypothetical protein